MKKIILTFILIFAFLNTTNAQEFGPYKGVNSLIKTEKGDFSFIFQKENDEKQYININGNEASLSDLIGDGYHFDFDLPLYTYPIALTNGDFIYIVFDDKSEMKFFRLTKKLEVTGPIKTPDYLSSISSLAGKSELIDTFRTFSTDIINNDYIDEIEDYLTIEQTKYLYSKINNGENVSGVIFNGDLYNSDWKNLYKNGIKINGISNIGVLKYSSPLTGSYGKEVGYSYKKEDGELYIFIYGEEFGPLKDYDILNEEIIFNEGIYGILRYYNSNFSDGTIMKNGYIYDNKDEYKSYFISRTGKKYGPYNDLIDGGAGDIFGYTKDDGMYYVNVEGVKDSNFNQVKFNKYKSQLDKALPKLYKKYSNEKLETISNKIDTALNKTKDDTLKEVYIYLKNSIDKHIFETTDIDVFINMYDMEISNDLKTKLQYALDHGYSEPDDLDDNDINEIIKISKAIIDNNLNRHPDFRNLEDFILYGSILRINSFYKYYTSNK